MQEKLEKNIFHPIVTKWSKEMKKKNQVSLAHWLYLNLNDKKTSHFYWRVPGMLETSTIPKKKEFLKLRWRFLR